jgi:TP901 family phage tail tape measure protein
MNPSRVLVQLRLLGAQAFVGGTNAASRGLGKIGGQGTVANRALGGVNKTIGLLGVAMKTIGTAGAIGMGAALGYAVKKGANFEQSMANVQARLLTSKKNMELLSQQALDLGAKTSFSAQQSADAMGEYAAAGFNAQQIMKIMPGTLNLAAASGTDLASAAELTGAVIRQFGLRAKDAGHVADVMTVAVNKSAIGMDDLAYSMKYVGPVAGRFNQSLEDIGAATAILGNVGIKGETAGTTLRRALVNLVKPSGKTKDMLKGMGITMGEFNRATIDAHGDLRPMPAILGNLSKQFAGLTKPQRRKALAQLFGVEALPGMITLMDMGEPKIRKMSQSLTNSGGAARKTAKIMRGTVKGAWDNFTGSIESAAISLERRFNPVLRNSINRAAGLIDKGSKAAQGFVAGISGDPKTKVQAPGSVAATAPRDLSGAEKAGIKARAVLQGVVTWAQKNLPKIGAQVVAVGRQIVDAFRPAAPFLQNVLIPLLKGVAVGVISGVVMSFKVVLPVIKAVMTALGWLGNLLRPLRGVFFALGVVIGWIAGGPILKALGAVSKLGIVFRLMLVPVRLANGIFGRLFGWIGKAAGAFVRAHLAVLRFVATFASSPARVARAALNIVGTIIHTVSTLHTRLARLAISVGSRLMSGIANGVRSKLGAIGSFFARVGKSMLDAIVNAIKAAPGAIGSALMSIVPGPLKRFAKKLIPGAATGGTFLRGGAAIVGERGPELATFPTGTTVYDAKQTRKARTSMAPSRPDTFVANLHIDGKQVHSVVFERNRQMAEAR